MDISKITGYFHDGSLISIDHENNKIIIVLESGYINPKELNNIPLSPESTLRGKLVLQDVEYINVNDTSITGSLEKVTDDGEVLDLYIFPERVELLIEWKTYPPARGSQNVSHIVIGTKNTHWENIPFLSLN